MRATLGTSFAVLFACFPVFPQMLSNQGVATTREPTQTALHYDRIEVLQRFLKTVYPDLPDLGMLKIESTFEDGHWVRIRKLEFYPCRPQRVEVPQRNDTPPPLISPLSRATSPVSEATKPACGEGPTPEFEHFLDVFLELGAAYQARPFFKFAASGSYVDLRLQGLRQQFSGKHYPSDDEAIQDLLLKNPKYGPDRKKQFLTTVPVERIRELTGCRLRPETATFVVTLDRNYLPPDLQWHIYGTAPATDALTPADCSASFEPFEGRLTLFLD